MKLTSWMAALIASAASHAAATVATLPPNTHRVVFLGDSITYAGKYIVDIETYFRTRHPEDQVEFINVGLPSETVSGLSEPNHAGGQFPRPDLHERLARVLAGTRPDIVFACYGMNDGIYQPFDQKRFKKYQDGLKWLKTEVEKTGVRIAFITPPTFDGKVTKNPAYEETLNRYADWLLGQRSAGWKVVDLHGPMNAYLAERRAKDPEFAYNKKDGVHPDDLGHWIMAKQVLLFLGGTDIANAGDAAAMVAAYPHGAEIAALVEQEQGITKDAWLTDIGHKRPGMAKGLPLDQAGAKAKDLESQIQNLISKNP